MREFESASSLTTFLKCPYAYRLSYIDGAEFESNETIEYGRFIHKELELDSLSPEVLPFKAALQVHLNNTDDKIINRELRLTFQIDDQPLQAIIDFKTQNRVFGEMKVTGSPGYYQSHLSYQVRLYNLALAANEQPGFIGKYFLFEIDKKTKKFKELHVVDNFETNLGQVESLNQIRAIIRMLRECQKEDTFPPSYNNCYQCGYKNSCQFYAGF